MRPSWQQVRPSILVFLLACASVIFSGTSHAQEVDIFDSPLAPLPPQLFDDVGRESLKLDDHQLDDKTLPKLLPPGNTSREKHRPGPVQDQDDFLEPELSKLHDLIRKLRQTDGDQAKAIENALRKSIQEQTKSAKKRIVHSSAAKFQSRHPFVKPRFANAEQLIRILRASEASAKNPDTTKAIDRISAKLARLQKGRKYRTLGELDHNSAAEVHHVVIDGIRGASRETVEVQVTHRASPIILVLSSPHANTWNLTKVELANLLAVVTDSDRQQIVRGVPNTIVIRSQEFSTLPATMFPNPNSSGSAKLQLKNLLSNNVTRFRQTSDTKETVVIGPENDDWLNAYLVWHVEALIAELHELRHRVQSEGLGDLRFNAVFTQRYENQHEASFGRFNIHGPIASSLTPLPHPQLTRYVVAQSETESQAFGLNQRGHFVTVSDDEEETEQVEPTLKDVPNTVSKSLRFASIAYDRDDQRIVLATFGQKAELLAFSWIAKTWKRIAALEDETLLAVACPEPGVIWAIASEVKKKNSYLVQFDAGGKVLSKNRITDATTNGYELPQLVGGQLVPCDGLMVLVGQNRNEQKHAAFVLNPNTGELLFRNQLEINNGSARTSALNGPEHLLLALDRQLRAARRLSERRARPMRSRLAAIESVVSKQAPTSKPRSSLPSLHVVARYSSTRPVQVKVTDDRGPVTLVLCGHHRMDWSVEAAPGVKLDRILLTGHLPQTVTEKPPNVIVEIHTNERNTAIRDPRDRSKLLQFEARLQQLTGQSVSSFSVSHQASGRLILGPENVTWRLQVAKHELDHLHKELARPTEEQVAVANRNLSRFRFHAMHQGPMPRGVRNHLGPQEAITPAFQSRNRQTRDMDVHWSEFSLRGPLIGNSIPVDRSVRFGIAGLSKRWLCTGTINSVSITEGKQNSRAAKLLSNNQSIGHLAGVGFDEDRQRLLVCGGRGLFSCSMSDKRWTRLRALNGLTRTGFAYSSKDDVAYAIRSRSRGEVHSIERFNANGVPLPPLKLSNPISLGSPYSYGYANVQLIAHDGYLALLRYQHQQNQRLPGGGRFRKSPVGRLSLIQLGESLDAAGEVVLETVVRPSLLFREIPDDELNVIWQELGHTESSPDEVENKLWLMAAGGEGTLEFFRSKFEPDDAPLTDAMVSKLVTELDSDSFEVRENAFRELQVSNNRIAPTLRATLAENPSQEVSDRLKHILRTWESGTPQTSHDLRMVRAIDAISRMGTASADEFLRSLVEPQYSSLIRFHAQQSLATRENEPIKFENPVLRMQQKLFVPRNPNE